LTVRSLAPISSAICLLRRPRATEIAHLTLAWRQLRQQLFRIVAVAAAAAAHRVQRNRIGDGIQQACPLDRLLEKIHGAQSASLTLWTGRRHTR
jgi:hypothetical protein